MSEDQAIRIEVRVDYPSPKKPTKDVFSSDNVNGFEPAELIYYDDGSQELEYTANGILLGKGIDGESALLNLLKDLPTSTRVLVDNPPVLRSGTGRAVAKEKNPRYPYVVNESFRKMIHAELDRIRNFQDH